MNELRASEGGHWYDRQGNPCYEVKARNGSMRPTTLRDAKSKDLVPSVTTILKTAAQPGLDAWKAEQLLHAALTLPRREQESEQDYAKRVISDSREQSMKARDKGTEIHAMVERWFCGFSGVKWDMKVLDGIHFELHRLNLPSAPANWTAENTFASPLGFGGKVDLYNAEAVIDFKTKSNWKEGDKLGYDEHAMQLAAYDAGLRNAQLCDGRIIESNRPDWGVQIFEFRRHINIFISTEEPGKVQAVEWEETERYWSMFSALLTFWKLKNKI